METDPEVIKNITTSHIPIKLDEYRDEIARLKNIIETKLDVS